MRFFDEDPTSIVHPDEMVRSLVFPQGVEIDDLDLEGLALVTFTSSDLKEWLEPGSSAKPLQAWRKRGYWIYRRDGYVVAQSSIGAAASVMQLEEFAAFGVKRVIYLGYCGSLMDEVRVGDLVIPTEAIREEGTSYHYLPEGRRCFPDSSLQDRIFALASASGFTVRQGAVWTTDAPYRETKSKVYRYGREGVLGVEMEMSALFAVASVRNVSIGAMLLVSDELNGGVWRKGFFSNELRESRKKVIETFRPRLKALRPEGSPGRKI